MKDQLKKTFSDTSRHIPTKKEEVIKAEDTFLTAEFSQMAIEGFNAEQEHNPFKSTNSQQTHNQELDTYYSRGNYPNYNRRSNINGHYQQQPEVRSTQNNMKQMQQTQRRKNPRNRNDLQLRCHICKSIYHLAQNCPEKYNALYTQENVLYQSDFDHPEQLKTLVSESWNSAVLDSGTTNTVAGEVWYNCYITSLNKNK